jgi:aspartyl-tRNA(Asn)/glutamyl-tRNA(Gln) amidotransferase subunit A
VAASVDVAPRTSLNDPVGTERRFGLVRVPFDDVGVVRRAFGGTVNDVVLAGLGGGLARLLASRGELRPDLTLQVFCPVSLREDAERMQLGNRLSAIFVPVPVGEPDPVARLRAVRTATADLKLREQPLGTATLLGLGELVPPPVVGLAARAIHRQPFFHLVCTNIPGPQSPLYCLGARMLEAYPLVPLSTNMNLNVAVLSYAGQVHFGLLADRARWPDLAVLEAGLDEAFAELRKLAAAQADRPAEIAGSEMSGPETSGGEVRAAAVLDVHLDRIARLDPELNAVCFLDADAARTRAGAIDAAVARGEDPGPLAGVPIGVKELASVRGWPETHASVVYADAVATTDDTEVARLRAAGAVLTGLTTASEQGTVSFTNTPLHGITRNPWDPARTPGGSSGGSAAAVAAGLFPVCTGGDGGGSIRIPASYCGLFGMKSTFGLVGSGPGAFDMSLNSVRGPMARSVRDAARYLDVVAGPTPTDPTSLPRPAVSFETEIVSGAAQERLRGLRAAFVDSVGFAGARSDVATVARDAASALVDAAGFELVEVEIELPKPGASWGVLSSINDMAWHLDAVRDHLDELTPVHRASFESVVHLRPDVLLKVVRRRHELLVALAAVFAEVDVLLTPTTPTPAFEAEGRLRGEVEGREVSLFGLSAAFTAPFNLSGQPAASMPAGTVDGLPVGLQVVAPRHHDLRPLGAGAVLEEVRPWPRLAPDGPTLPPRVGPAPG